MNTSHLYSGFRYAGALPSIRRQRELQARWLHRLQPRRVLTVGCGYGEELRTLLGAGGISDPRLTVTAVDLSDVECELRAHQFAMDLGPRLRWVQINLLDLERLPGHGEFDFVQCGFVLHDIPPNAKDRAMQLLARASHLGGYLLISEICVRPRCEYALEISEIYDAFLRESEEAVRLGGLGEHGQRLLIGDGAGPGLLRSKLDALRGDRDFFETVEDTVERATKCGLQVRRVMPNRCNDRLCAFLFQRSGNDIPNRRVIAMRGASNVQ